MPARKRRPLLLAGALAALAAPSIIAACSLGNVRQDDCAADSECVTVFGLGSRCSSGFCTTAPACAVDDDCIALFDRGTCIDGVCASTCEGRRSNGAFCFACPPTTTPEFYNACTSSACEPFDQNRVTNLPADGKLPPLP